MTEQTNEVYVILMLMLVAELRMMSGGMRGSFWLNESGEDLLSFLATNKGMVYSTWFKKKDIHKGTLQHPK